jgi:hypothetical protein
VLSHWRAPPCRKLLSSYNNRDEHHRCVLGGAVICIHQRGVHPVGSLLLSGVVLSAPAMRGGFVFDARREARRGRSNAQRESGALRPDADPVARVGAWATGLAEMAPGDPTVDTGGEFSRRPNLGVRGVEFPGLAAAPRQFATSVNVRDTKCKKEHKIQ